MHLEDLFRDGEKDLSPIFSATMVSVLFGGLWIMILLLFLSWPYSPLFQYLLESRIPWTFYSVFAGALIVISYMNLRLGLGEIIPKVVSARTDREGLITHEEETDYGSYALPQQGIHTLTLILLFFPFLLLGGLVNGTTCSDFFVALGILFSASFLCRQGAFLGVLLWGRWSPGAYWGGRIFFLLLLFGTGFFFPEGNPLLLLFNLHFGERIPLGPVVSSPLPYFLLSLFLFLTFTLLSRLMIKRKRTKRNQE